MGPVQDTLLRAFLTWKNRRAGTTTVHRKTGPREVRKDQIAKSWKNGLMNGLTPNQEYFFFKGVHKFLGLGKSIAINDRNYFACFIFKIYPI